MPGTWRMPRTQRARHAWCTQRAQRARHTQRAQRAFLSGA